MTVANLLSRPIVPVASPEDAKTTYERLRPYLLETAFTPLVVHVIEKAGGAPDKAGVEQRKEYANEVFEAFTSRATTDGVEVKTKLLFGTDIAETIHEAADTHDATSIVFRSRGESRWLELLSGNVRANLISEQNCPIVILPDESDPS